MGSIFALVLGAAAPLLFIPLAWLLARKKVKNMDAYMEEAILAQEGLGQGQAFDKKIRQQRRAAGCVVSPEVRFWRSTLAQHLKQQQQAQEKIVAQILEQHMPASYPYAPGVVLPMGGLPNSYPIPMPEPVAVLETPEGRPVARVEIQVEAPDADPAFIRGGQKVYASETEESE